MADIKEFDDYLNKTMDSLALTNEEREELKEEWQQHLIDLKNQYIQSGYARNDAIQLSLKQFGEPSMLQDDIKQKFPNYKYTWIVKELCVWLLCLIACTVAPLLLIQAHYSLLFLWQPLIILVMCSSFYHLLVKRTNNIIICGLGLPVLYGYFLIQYLLQVSWSEIYNIVAWLPLGSEGLFTIFYIHLMWLIIVIGTIKANSRKQWKWPAAVRASFHYWMMIASAFTFVKSDFLASSAEGNVFLLNIFLLYAILHQVLKAERMIIMKNKVHFWLNKGSSI